MQHIPLMLYTLTIPAESCSCRTGASQVAHLCVGPSSSPCDCKSFQTCEVSVYMCAWVPYKYHRPYAFYIHMYSQHYLISLLNNSISVHTCFISLFNAKCIDPYVKDTKSGECSLDTDGDTIPDYRASTILFSIATLEYYYLCFSILLLLY